MKRTKDVDAIKTKHKRSHLETQITKLTASARSEVPRPWIISLMDHLFDRMLERCGTDDDIVNVTVLINKAIRHKLCEIVYAFTLGHTRVILVHGKYHIALTYHRSEYGNFVQFRTIMIEKGGLKTRQRAYHILIN